MCFKKVSIFAASLLFANSLTAANIEEIVNQLKAKAGTTLKNPVMFVHYGDGAFDWLAVTTDGKYAAKLDGMNPDGTFRYTILGDPQMYGLKFDISLTGMKITTLQNDTASSVENVQETKEVTEKKVKTATVAISAFVSNSALTSPTGVRNLSAKTNPYFSLTTLIPKISSQLKTGYTRQVFTEACDEGGSVSISVNSRETDASWNFHSCKMMGVVFNGTINLTSYDDGYHIQGSYRNFSAQTSQFTTSIPSATFSLAVNDYEELENFTLQIPRSTVTYHPSNVTIESKNYRLKLRESGSEIILNIETDYKANCQNKWSHLTTTNDIRQNLYQLCPHVGTLHITNTDTDIEVRFNRNSSIDIIDMQNGNLLQHYTSCRQLPPPISICDR